MRLTVMYRFIVLAFTLLCVVESSFPVTAQERTYGDGCDEAYRTAIQATTSQFDFLAGCQAYRTCLQDSDGDALTCELAMLDYLTAQCAPDDATCSQNAILYAAAPQIFRRVGVYTLPPRDALLDAFVTGLRAFQAQEYDEAYQAFAFDTQGAGIYTFTIARTLALHAMGETAQARDEIEPILERVTFEPLMIYTRLMFDAALGEPERASRDIEVLRQFMSRFNPLELLTPLIEAYPFDETTTQTWMLYPVQWQYLGPGGVLTESHVQAEPVPIQLMFEPDGSIGISLNWIPAAATFEHVRNVDRMLVFTEADPENRLWRPSDNDRLETVYITRHGDVLIGQESRDYYEVINEVFYLIAREGQPDPRSELDGQHCGAVSRVRPGMSDLIVSSTGYGFGAPYFVYDAPNGSSVERPFTEVTADQSECHDDVLWWQISHDGEVLGWVPETSQRTYLIDRWRFETMRSPFYCPAARPSQLFIGAPINPANLYATPSRDAEQISTAPPLTDLTITDGPVCGESDVWWQVMIDAQTAWFVE